MEVPGPQLKNFPKVTRFPMLVPTGEGKRGRAQAEDLETFREASAAGMIS